MQEVEEKPAEDVDIEDLNVANVDEAEGLGCKADLFVEVAGAEADDKEMECVVESVVEVAGAEADVEEVEWVVNSVEVAPSKFFNHFHFQGRVQREEDHIIAQEHSNPGEEREREILGYRIVL